MKLFSSLTWVVALCLAGAEAHAGKVAIVVFQGSAETQQRVLRTAESVSRRLGHEVVLRDAQGSLNTYARMLDELIDQHVDAMVLGMGKPTDAQRQYERAHHAGIPIAAITTGYSPHFALHIDANHYAAGVHSALRLIDQAGRNANIATIRFEKNFGSRARGRTFDAVVAEHPELHVLDSHTMTDTQNWQSDVALGMHGLLDSHGGALQGLWVSFDGQAAIADDVMRMRGITREQIRTVTVDGSQDIYRRIASPDSTLVATYAIPFEAMATLAAESVDGWLRGTTPVPATPQALYLDAPLVDARNVHDFLQP